MRNLIVLSVLFIAACSTNQTSQKPWVCSSNTDPIDAEILFIKDGVYYYDCLWNGNGSGDGDGEGSAE